MGENVLRLLGWGVKKEKQVENTGIEVIILLDHASGHILKGFSFPCDLSTCFLMRVNTARMEC